MSRIDGHCTGRGGDTTSLTAHCRRTESRVLPDLEDRTTLTTASELEVRCIPTVEAAPPSLGAGDRRNHGGILVIFQSRTLFVVLVRFRCVV